MVVSIRCYIYVMTNVTESASEELLSTVAMLPDQVLLEQTRMLARHEQALQLSVLDHLREIDARRLYLRLGYSSLFDYTVRELHYTEASAWRRIKAMRLCRETSGVRERLQDGSLNLSNAALLQNSFERWERSGGGPLAAGSPAAGRGAAGSATAGTSAAPGAGSAPAAAPARRRVRPCRCWMRTPGRNWWSARWARARGRCSRCWPRWIPRRRRPPSGCGRWGTGAGS